MIGAPAVSIPFVYPNSYYITGYYCTLHRHHRDSRNIRSGRAWTTGPGCVVTTGFGRSNNCRRRRHLHTSVRRNSATSIDSSMGVDEMSSRHDFYSILGVHPMASSSEIKDAYRSLMKTCHPDMMQEEYRVGDDLAVILNLIYQILMDERQRAEYDVLAGFSQADRNPFDGCHHGNRTRTDAARYVFVDEYSCIGCHGCVGVDPTIFHIDAKDEYGRARCLAQHGAVDTVEMAMDVCPVSCIHWVTASQLTLLEEVMGKIGRVDAFLLMRSQGKV